MKAWILRWGPAILVMAIIFVASGTPGADVPAFGAWDLFAKKGGHMLGYALLATAYFHALNTGRNRMGLQFFLAFLLACLFAVSDEWHQRFTPGRSPSIQDVIIDVIGAGIGVISGPWIYTRFLRKKQPEINQGLPR